LEKLDRALVRVLKVSSVVSLVGLFILIAAGVFVRFVPISSMGWADEVIELAFAWMVFLGAALLWGKRSHFRVDVLPAVLSGFPAGRLLEIGLQILCLAFFLVYTHQASLLTVQSMDCSPILDYPRAIWYLIMPITGAVIIGYIIRDLFLLFRGKLGQWK